MAQSKDSGACSRTLGITNILTSFCTAISATGRCLLGILDDWLNTILVWIIVVVLFDALCEFLDFIFNKWW